MWCESRKKRVISFLLPTFTPLPVPPREGYRANHDTLLLQVSNWMENTLLVIAGPTASGKTDLALRLAKAYGTEIISADSRQMYREMSIGTAVPSLSERASVPHHFVQHLSIHQYYNVSMYEQAVMQLLPSLFAKNSVVVMVGGSGLYMDAVCCGIDDLPSVDMTLRNELQNKFGELGIEWLRSQLRLLDPVHYDKVDLRNPQRMLKALEVCLQTGQPYSSFLTAPRRARNFRIMKLGLTLPREELNTRINQRVDEMVAAGLVNEVESLYEHRHLNALKTVGYKEIFEAIEKQCTLEEAIEQIKLHTRKYAKRQMTWFQRDNSIRWVHPFQPAVIEAALP